MNWLLNSVCFHIKNSLSPTPATDFHKLPRPSYLFHFTGISDAYTDIQYGHTHFILLGNMFKINEVAKTAEDRKQQRSEGGVF